MIAIQNRAFSGTSITSISIPSNVYILGNNIFNLCKYLQIIEFTNNIQYFYDIDKIIQQDNSNTIIIMIPVKSIDI